MTNSKEKQKLNVVVLSFLLNILLFLVKLIVSYKENSIALRGDAFHSLADVLVTLIAFIGITLSKKKPTKTFPFGFNRFECVLSIIIAFVLFFTAVSIFESGIEQISKNEKIRTFSLSIIVTIFCIIIKESLFIITKRVGEKTSSTVLIADAYHHQADAFASIGALLGLVGARFNLFFAEGVACVIISLFIIKASISVFIDSLNKLVDKSSSFSLRKCEIESLKLQGIVVESVRSRQFSSQIIVDVFIDFDNDIISLEKIEMLKNLRKKIVENNSKIKELNFILKL